VVILIKLPNGVTGFYDSKHNQPPKIDGKQFKQLCFTVITGNGGKIMTFKEPQITANFFDAEVKVSNKHMHILLNAHYPFLAFASFVNFGNIEFIDAPQLYRDFSPYYKVLSVYEINKPLVIKEVNGTIVLENDNELNSAELKQLAYWKPKRIGDVVFNFWD
jgi:hypothetical protein